MKLECVLNGMSGVFILRVKKILGEVSSKRISLNSIGALAPMGNSYIAFQERTNAFTMMLFLLELLRENCVNEEDYIELNRLINLKNTNPELVKEEMKFELASKEKDFSKKVEAINDLDVSCEVKRDKLERLLGKFTVSNFKLMHRLRSNQRKNIENSSLYKKFRGVVIVWDNAKSHIAIHIKELLDFLGVKIVPLPVRCPEYNPIEQVWADNKYQTTKEPIDDENDLKNFFEEQFYDLVEINNYDGYWYDLIQSKRNFYQEYLKISI
jgi:transposase